MSEQQKRPEYEIVLLRLQQMVRQPEEYDKGLEGDRRVALLCDLLVAMDIPKEYRRDVRDRLWPLIGICSHGSGVELVGVCMHTMSED